MLAHWAFGGGWLQANGTLDFAGGVPVEMGSGFSALAAALVVGARKDYGRQALLPHNAVYVLLGAGLLWFGWFGFNGGSGFSTGNPSVLAFTNTLLTPACTLVVWFGLDLLRGRKVTAIGAATAIVVGCVAITPAGGFISPGWAMLLGGLAALPSYAIIVWRTRTRVDETLDVLAAHGTAGFFGILFIGFFAELSWNGVSNGLFYGNAAQLGDQALAALAGPTYAFVATFVLLKLIGAVMPLRAIEARGGARHGRRPARRGGLRHRRGRDPRLPRGRRRRPGPGRRPGLTGLCGHLVGRDSFSVTNQVGGALGDGDRRGVGVAARHGRHHRGVDDAQRLSPSTRSSASTTEPIAQVPTGW